VLLTRAPLSTTRRWLIVRLACVRHAASVRSEPGSNSQVDPTKKSHITYILKIKGLFVATPTCRRALRYKHNVC
jgi:hypothetical protein